MHTVFWYGWCDNISLGLLLLGSGLWEASPPPRRRRPREAAAITAPSSGRSARRRQPLRGPCRSPPGYPRCQMLGSQACPLRPQGPAKFTSRLSFCSPVPACPLDSPRCWKYVLGADTFSFTPSQCFLRQANFKRSLSAFKSFLCLHLCDDDCQP